MAEVDEVGMGAAISGVALGGWTVISFITTPVGIVICLIAGLAMVGALADGPVSLFSFFNRGFSFSSSSAGGNFLLAATRSTVFFLYAKDEVFNALASAIIHLMVVKSGFNDLFLLKSSVIKLEY